MKRRIISTTMVGIAALCSGPVFAQQAVSTTASAPSEGIPEVVVTATRRSENLQNTPLAITAVSGSQLQSAGVTEPQDLGKTVAGLSIAPEGSQSQIYLRGVGTFTTAPYSDTTVATNYDGVVLAFPAENLANFYDIQRVEVLKGPQGTLYGRNATAGAINILTNKPTFEFGGDGSLELGNYNLVNADGALNVPINDQLAIREAFQVIRRDGYLSDGQDDARTQGDRLQALYKPNDDISLLIGGDYSHEDDRGSGSVPVSVAVPQPDPSNAWLGPSTPRSLQQLNAASASIGPFGPLDLASLNNDAYARSESYGLHAELNWNLGFATLTALPSYRHVSQQNLTEPGFIVGFNGSGYQTTAEVRLASPSEDRWTWLAGLYYFDDSFASFEPVNQGLPFVLSLDPTETATSYAEFGETQFKVTDRFRLIAGIRHTNETKHQSGDFTSVLFGGPPLSFNYDAHARFANVSYKAGAEFDVTPKSLLYATVTTGFKAGGLNTDTGSNAVYQPEKITAYALGTKNRFFDNKVVANAELFHWDYKNHQENVFSSLDATPGSNTVLTKNIDKATVEGLDLDLKYAATPVDRFSAQAEYLHAVFDKFSYINPLPIFLNDTGSTGCAVSAVGATTKFDCDGKPFTHAPKWAFTVSYQHTFHLGESGDLVASADSQLQTDSYYQIDYIPAEKQPAYNVTDVDLTYIAPAGDWSVMGYVRNIGNTVVHGSGYEQPSVPGLVYATIRPPRTFGVILKKSF